MLQVKCTGCGLSADPEHPETVRALNAETMRWGWMHTFCMVVAYENCSPERKQKARDKHEFECK